jgi:hypothetical protein
MLLIYGCYRPEGTSPEYEAKVGAVRAFAAECQARGVLRAADPLFTTEHATTIRVREGEAMVTDGPFAETNEQLGGYFILECSRDEAIELAQLCPMAAEGAVEVRPIIETGLAAARPD